MFRKPLLMIGLAVFSTAAFASESDNCKARCETNMQDPEKMKKCLAECEAKGGKPSSPIGKPKPRPPMVPTK